MLLLLLLFVVVSCCFLFRCGRSFNQWNCAALFALHSPRFSQFFVLATSACLCSNWINSFFSWKRMFTLLLQFSSFIYFSLIVFDCTLHGTYKPSTFNGLKIWRNRKFKQNRKQIDKISFHARRWMNFLYIAPASTCTDRCTFDNVTA